MSRIRILGHAALAIACAAAPAVAGPGYNEMGDAGSTKPTAQPVKNTTGGPVLSVNGSLSIPLGGPADSEDMYIIKIDDAIGFSAATGSDSQFDSQLWLFRYDTATGLLGNDDIAVGDHHSRIAPPANDGTGQTIPGPGLYLLAITSHGNSPLSSAGQIFRITNPTEISGPDGPGGGQPHTAWTGDGSDAGAYAIHLQGVSFIIESPIPTASEWSLMVLTAGLLAAGAWTARRRARVASAQIGSPV